MEKHQKLTKIIESFDLSKDSLRILMTDAAYDLLDNMEEEPSENTEDAVLNVFAKEEYVDRLYNKVFEYYDMNLKENEVNDLYMVITLPVFGKMKRLMGSFNIADPLTNEELMEDMTNEINALAENPVKIPIFTNLYYKASLN